jgi:hypothetical protein
MGKTCACATISAAIATDAIAIVSYASNGLDSILTTVLTKRLINVNVAAMQMWNDNAMSLHVKLKAPSKRLL